MSFGETMTLEDHCNLQRILVKRLKETGYTQIQQNLEYRVPACGGALTGELDVLAYSPHGRWHVYEIKSCSHKVERARAQIMRAQAALPQYAPIRGVYVSPHKIKIIC